MNILECFLHLCARNSIAMHCIWIRIRVKVSQNLFAASPVVKIMIVSRFRLKSGESLCTHVHAYPVKKASTNKLSIQFWRC